MSLSLAEHHQPASEVRKYRRDKEAEEDCIWTHQTFEESFFAHADTPKGPCQTIGGCQLDKMKYLKINKKLTN